MKSERTERYIEGDLVYWHQKVNDVSVPHFGIIIYRYCEDSKMKAFLKKRKTVIYDRDSEELKEFYINEIKEIGEKSDSLWTLSDKFIMLISCGKYGEA